MRKKRATKKRTKDEKKRWNNERERPLQQSLWIHELRPPADYVKSIKLKEVGKNGHLGHFMVSPNLNHIVRHPGQPHLQDHMQSPVKSLIYSI